MESSLGAPHTALACSGGGVCCAGGQKQVVAVLQIKTPLRSQGFKI
jgi:hypothetical protein